MRSIRLPLASSREPVPSAVDGGLGRHSSRSLFDTLRQQQRRLDSLPVMNVTAGSVANAQPFYAALHCLAIIFLSMYIVTLSFCSPIIVLSFLLGRFFMAGDKSFLYVTFR
jgi:hypothetical protein